MDLSFIALPEKAVRAEELKRVAMGAPTPEIRDAVLLNGLLGLVGEIEAALAERGITLPG
jgi:hypothetical protein